MKTRIYLIGVLTLFMAGCCNHVSKSTRLFYVEMFLPNDDISSPAIVEINQHVAAYLSKHKANIEWEVYAMPVVNGVKMVFIPLYSGYDIPEELKEGITQEVELTMARHRAKSQQVNPHAKP